MSTLNTIATRGWFGGDGALRFTYLALDGWLGTSVSVSRRDLTALRVLLRLRLIGDASFASLLGAPNAVYHRHPPLAAPIPSIVYELTEEAGNKFVLRMQLRAKHPAILDDLLDGCMRLLEGYRVTSTNWFLHQVSLMNSGTRTATRSPLGPCYTQEVEYRIEAAERLDGTTAVATTIQLSKDVTSLLVPVPAQVEVERTRLQSRGESHGGTTYLYDGGRVRIVHKLMLVNLDEATATALRDFFTIVEGMRQTFTYTDETATARTVRFADRTLTLVRDDRESWTATIRLEEV